MPRPRFVAAVFFECSNREEERIPLVQQSQTVCESNNGIDNGNDEEDDDDVETNRQTLSWQTIWWKRGHSVVLVIVGLVVLVCVVMVTAVSLVVPFLARSDSMTAAAAHQQQQQSQEMTTTTAIIIPLAAASTSDVDLQVEQWEQWKHDLVAAKYLQLDDIAAQDNHDHVDIDSSNKHTTTTTTASLSLSLQLLEESLLPDQARVWWQEVQQSTAHEANATKQWINAKVAQTNEWLNTESNKTNEWLDHESNQTKKWLDKEENQTQDWIQDANDWFQTEAQATKHAADKAGQWMTDEAGDAQQWMRDEENITQHWVDDEVKRSGDWMGYEAERTKKWFDHTTNATGRWIRHAAKTSADWFQKEANATQHWFQDEANVTGHWIQRQSNRTVHWFEADVEDVRIWWNNVTHRDRVEDESLVYFNSTAAFTLLVDGYGWYDSSRDFFTYQEGLDVQENQAYCAVATSAAVLNSLRGLLSASSSSSLPTDPLYKPFPYATQNSLFNTCTETNVIVRNSTFDGILKAPGGLGLEQTKSLLECNLPNDGWTVEAYHVDPSVTSMDDLRRDLVLALMSPSSRVLVNFHRASVNQVGGGHFSPVGSYSHQRDAFLVMDVAKYKYPFVWIPTSMLYRSLMTVDACGIWNYPGAQVKLKTTHPELLQPKSARALSHSLPKLGCKASYRGYIVVKQAL